jgi:hypothetical protein
MNGDASLRHFFLGVVLLLVVQAVFMLGGYALEKALGVPVTGIPTAIGLTLVFLCGVLSVRRASQFVLLGSFTLAFLSPLILLLLLLAKALPVDRQMVNASLYYQALLTIGVWAYFGVRIMRGKL